MRRRLRALQAPGVYTLALSLLALATHREILAYCLIKEGFPDLAGTALIQTLLLCGAGAWLALEGNRIVKEPRI